MFQPNTQKNRHQRKPVAKIVHLETHLTEGGPDSFYTGFSGKIQDGGIFITTYRLLEKYTPVEVSIHFPDGHTIRPRGTVEWIRDANPDISDTLPGLGISFFDLRPEESDLIESWILIHPPVFLDNVEISAPPPANDTIADNIELETLPINLGPGCDLNEEHLFVNGLARDISHYLNERPLTWLRRRIEQENRAFENCIPDNVWTLRVLPHDRRQKFQGAFHQTDPVHRLFVNTGAPVAIGSHLHLQVLCENGTRLGCTGEVRWIRKHNPLVNHHFAPAGMGIVLENVKSNAWTSINPKNAEIVQCETVR